MQQYYNHDGNFYKVYVVGADVMVYRRPSLPNLDDVSLCNAGITGTGIQSVEFDSRFAYPRLDAFIKGKGKCSDVGVGVGENGRGNVDVDVDVDVDATISPASKKSNGEEQNWRGEVENRIANSSPKFSNLLASSPPLQTSMLPPSTLSSQTIPSSPPSLPPCPSLPLSSSHVIDKSLFLAAANAIRTEFGLSLFGFDVITPRLAFTPEDAATKKPNSTSEQHLIIIIDVNYFPSYKEVEDFPTRLRSFLKKRVVKEQ